MDEQRALTEEESRILEGLLEQAKTLGTYDDLAACDALFTNPEERWEEINATVSADKKMNARPTDEELVGILGASIGDILARKLDMPWMIVTDQWGTEYALYEKEPTEIMLFPMDAVSKRWERKEDTLTEYVEGVLAHVEHLRSL